MCGQPEDRTKFQKAELSEKPRAERTALDLSNFRENPMDGDACMCRACVGGCLVYWWGLGFSWLGSSVFLFWIR